MDRADIIVPDAVNYNAIAGGIELSQTAAKCMSQCTGCQCRSNTFSPKQIFDDVVVAPLEGVFSKILGKISPQQDFSAARCNCTSCNSCRCDCSCRFVPDQVQEVW